eukprot:PITA_32782
MEGGYTYPSATPTDTAGRKQYELDAKVVTILLGSLSQSEFVKVMQFKSAKEIWDKIILSYEGDDHVKCAKLQNLRIRYETLKMHSNEIIANYFLRIDEIVNYMRNLGEEIKEVVLVEKFLRSLSTKFESKVSSIEEREDLQKITMTQLYGILTTFEMRKGGPSDDVVKDQSITIQRLESKILYLKEDLKESKKKNKEALEEQEHEVLKLRQQVEEGRKAEENIRKQYLGKEEQHQVEVDILKGESSSQGEERNSNAKSEMINKEISGQPQQQPRKEILQRRSFPRNYGNDSRLFPQMNNVECYVCHNFGHIAARCRSKMSQDHHTERSSRSRYFKGYFFSYNMFGHKAIDCYRRNMKHVRCYACNKFGHKVRECRRKNQTPKQEDQTSSKFQVLKKTELETERCGITQLADITDTGETESVELRYSNLHTQIL